MCLAVPAQVVASDGMTALVDIYGDRFPVDITMLDEPVAEGDFVTVQARRFAVQKLAREEALAARSLFEEVFPELAARAEFATAELR
jgi:hydrogenase assembly chaperone HypC/HupF